MPRAKGEAGNVRETERLLEEARDLASIGGWEYDLELRRITWTPEVFRIHGLGEDFDPNDIATDISFYAPGDREAIATAFDRAVRFGEAYDLELELVRADGSRVWVRTMAKPLVEGGRVTRVTGNIMDIDVRKLAELEILRLNAELERKVEERTARLEATNRELECFAYSVSHDLKAPLRAIEGFSAILLEDYGPRLDAEGLRLLGVVRSGAVRMGVLISEILALSRVGLAELTPSPVDMRALARAMYRELATEEELAAFEFSLGPIPPAEGDATLLKLVWGNLISNALKYSRDSPRRRIEIDAVREPGYVRYRVADQGAGFDPALVGRLWKPFQRLHGEGRFEGNGIGLAIVKRVVERHGGRVGASGMEGRGAEFWFTLPSGRGEGECADAEA